MGAGKSIKLLSLKRLSFKNQWEAKVEGAEAPSPPVALCLGTGARIYDSQVDLCNQITTAQIG